MRRAKRAAVVAAPSVADLARRLHLAWNIHGGADRRTIANDGVADLSASRITAMADAEIDTLERLISITPAASLTDAAVQVMLAASRLDLTPSFHDEETSLSQNEVQFLYRLLRSALAALRRHVDGDLTDYGAGSYATNRSCPFAGFQAKKGGER